MGQIDGGEAYVAEEQYPRILNEFNKRMIKVGKTTKTRVIDLPSMVSHDATLFYDGMHFNEEGARAVADVVADFLIKNEMVERP